MRPLRIAALMLAVLAGLLPGCVAATWYVRSYYERTGYLPFPFGPCGFALEAAHAADALPSPINDSAEDSE
jgi:hypothetical protein